MAPKKLENNFFGEYTRKIIGVSELGKGCFVSFGTHYRYFRYFLWEK
jgi:hypothetical protein